MIGCPQSLFSEVALLMWRERTEVTEAELGVDELAPSTYAHPPADPAMLPAFPPADEEESALVAQARQDPAAFGVLYARYIDRVYAYIYHRVGNVQETEDLTARTFYRALDKLETYEDRGLPFSAWLFRIAHNLVANWHRDRSRRRFLSFDRLWSHSNEGDTPEEYLELAEKHEALWAAINRLPAERKDLLLYKFSSRLSNLEIGQMMDKSEGAIKSLYFRTLASLRKDLEGKGWGGLFGSTGEAADE
jgi:RNA polymerase sigma-70 factor, ECF subfamily